MSKRDAYVKKMKAELDNINAEIDAIEARVAKMAEPARKTFQGQLDKAKTTYASTKDKLQEIRSAGEESFEKYQGEAEHLWKTLQQSIHYFKATV